MSGIRCLAVRIRTIRNDILRAKFFGTKTPYCVCATYYSKAENQNIFYNKTILTQGKPKELVIALQSRTFFGGKSPFGSQSPAINTASHGTESVKLGIFQRYKKMVKEYWYVVIPVHIATSAVWFGAFYYAAKCGVDIVPLLEYLGFPDRWINPLRNSSLGHIAVASALYKIVTPARYFVTLGATTPAIKILTKRGLIKPMPSKAVMKEMVKQKRDDYKQRKNQ